MMSPQREIFALFDNARWPERPALLLTQPQATIEAFDAESVADALAAIEDGVKRGLTAAGVLSYELGYLFEPRLVPLMPTTGRSLIRFHLFARRQRLSPGERARWLAERTTSAGSIGGVAPSLSESAHRDAMVRVRELIGDGDVYQVNLTFKLHAKIGDPFAAYALLREKSRAGGCAFLRFGDEDVLSFSPELFFQVSGRRIAARPMKGTVARAPDAPGDLLRRELLLNDEKQRAENLMIVDLLRNDLARVSKPGSVAVDDLFTVETYPRFHTLTSGISAELLDSASFGDVVRALFPCGSVTGAPKIRAMEIIREVEREPRGAYCGAIGYVDGETMAFNVAIRTLTVHDGLGEMGVGGGIVWDSDPASEYAEAMLKARFLTEPDERLRLIETMRWTEGEGFHLLERHLARLSTSSRYFGFRFDERATCKALSEAVQDRHGLQRVRLTLGVRGDLQIESELLALPSTDVFWRYAIADEPTNSRDWRLYHKTTSRARYEQAFTAQRAATGCDEVLFVNERGELTEGSRTNLFVERDGLRLTPPLSCGLLDGCLRRELIENGSQRVVEHVLYPADLAYGNVWLGNSLRGLVRAQAVGAMADAAAPTARRA